MIIVKASPDTLTLKMAVSLELSTYDEEVTGLMVESGEIRKSFEFLALDWAKLSLISPTSPMLRLEVSIFETLRAGFDFTSTLT